MTGFPSQLHSVESMPAFHCGSGCGLPTNARVSAADERELTFQTELSTLPAPKEFQAS